MSNAVSRAQGGLKRGMPSTVVSAPTRSGMLRRRSPGRVGRAMDGDVRDGTYRMPVSWSNPAPPQLAAPIRPGSIRVPRSVGGV